MRRTLSIIVGIFLQQLCIGTYGPSNQRYVIRVVDISHHTNHKEGNEKHHQRDVTRDDPYDIPEISPRSATTLSAAAAADVLDVVDVSTAVRYRYGGIRGGGGGGNGDG